MHDCIIIGAGISGLSVAAWLDQKGKDVRVLEKASRVGGTMTSLYEDGYLTDFGPATVLHTTTLLDDLIRYADLEQQVCFANPQSSKRYVVHHGTIQALPSGPLSFLTTRLFSTRAKLRLLQEPFITPASHDESIAAFTRRRLGQEFLDYAINPFVSGIYAGDPDRLSVRWAFPKIYALERDYGSLIKGAIKGRKSRQQRQQKGGEARRDRAKIFSFRLGMETFPQGIAKRLAERVAMDCKIDTLCRTEHGLQLTYRQAGQSLQARARSVVLAIPAYAIDPYLQCCNPALPIKLADLQYAPVAQVFLGFRREQVGHPLDGFGVLIPQRENRHILGALWNSSLFPARAPQDHVALTCFLGGMRRPELAAMNDNGLLKRCLQDLTPLLKLQGKPEVVRIKTWSRAIPQYNLGYATYAERMATFEAQTPGVFLCGNFRAGIAVGDCVMQSSATAEKVTAFLNSTEGA
jgi:oxygen-dependent protoporphyrinogen oxidase